MKTTLALLLALLIAGTSFAKEPVTKSWDGFLIDKLCAGTTLQKKLTPEKTDAKIKAHTRECAMMEDCVASGYGIWSEGAFVPFEKSADPKVAALLGKTKKADHIAITVTGVMKGDNIAVASIKEKK